MGLDRFNKTPCGFCFVEYYTHQDALDCMKYIGGTKLDERVIRTDLDEGFAEGRQYGRGKSGGQVRDEYRDEDRIAAAVRGGTDLWERDTETFTRIDKNTDIPPMVLREPERFGYMTSRDGPSAGFTDYP